MLLDRLSAQKMFPLLKLSTADFRPVSITPKAGLAGAFQSFRSKVKGKSKEEWITAPIEISPEELLNIEVVSEDSKFAYAQRIDYFNSAYAKPVGLLDKYKEQISFILIGGIFLLSLMLTLKSFEKIAGDVVNSFGATSAVSTHVADALNSASENMLAIAKALGTNVASNATNVAPIG